MRGSQGTADRPAAWTATAVLLILALCAVVTNTAEAYEHRRRTPSIGAQIQYGYMAGSSGWAQTVRWGLGVTVSARQYVDRSRAIGITFEQQKFSRISTLPRIEGGTNLESLSHVQFQVLMLDYFFYFNRIRKETTYLVLSAGVYRPQELFKFTSIITGDEGEEATYPTEGFIARLGLGLEYFASRTLSVDASLSGYFVNATQFDKSTYTIQAAFGLMLYAGR